MSHSSCAAFGSAQAGGLTIEPLPPSSHTAKRGEEGQVLERQFKIGIAAFALVVGALAVASTGREGSSQKSSHRGVSAANLRLATLSTASRRDIDYAELDARLQRLVEKPTMVGLAVGIVENGRITFLHGYGETVEGSGEPVTPSTVFRWASVSKGVAATMTAKLAEQGKVNLEAPIATYNTSLRLPGGSEQVVLFERSASGLERRHVLTLARFVRLHGRYGFPSRS